MKKFITILSLITTFFFVHLSTAAEVGQIVDNTGGQNLNVSIPEAVIFDTFDINSPNITFDPATNPTHLTIDVTGKYEIKYSVNWTAIFSTNSRRQIKTFLRKNGITDIPQSSSYGYRRNEQAASATNSATFVLALTAGDYIEVMGQNSSSVGASVSTIAGESSLSVTYLPESHSVGGYIARNGYDVASINCVHGASVAFGGGAKCPDGETLTHSHPYVENGVAIGWRAYCSNDTRPSSIWAICANATP